jgi:hypothetical protein
MTSTRSFRLLVLALAIGLGAQPILAQEDVGSVAGKRVRIASKMAPNTYVTGKVVATSVMEVVLEPDGSSGQPTTFPIDEIVRMQVNTGTHNNLRAGMVTGLGIGALGAGIAIASTDDNSEVWAIGMIVGGVVVGGLIGSLITTDTWVEVAPSKLRMGLGPSPGGSPHLQLTWRF